MSDNREVWSVSANDLSEISIYISSRFLNTFACSRPFEALNELRALSLARVRYLLLQTVYSFLHGHHTLLKLAFAQDGRKRYLILFTCCKLRYFTCALLACRLELAFAIETSTTTKLYCDANLRRSVRPVTVWLHSFRHVRPR
jgi:hypothetical protein